MIPQKLERRLIDKPTTCDNCATRATPVVLHRVPTADAIHECNLCAACLRAGIDTFDGTPRDEHWRMPHAADCKLFSGHECFARQTIAAAGWPCAEFGRGTVVWFGNCRGIRDVLLSRAAVLHSIEFLATGK